jgi:hypothetical protein
LVTNYAPCGAKAREWYEKAVAKDNAIAKAHLEKLPNSGKR